MIGLNHSTDYLFYHVKLDDNFEYTTISPLKKMVDIDMEDHIDELMNI